MSGHSKWHSIRHKKAANDAKRGKVLTKHSKLISVVGRSDPNPDTNPSLRTVIANAKADGVPRDNIDRMLKKLSGEGKDGTQFSEQVYEGFGPEGVAFIVTALTDNVNRTFPSLRTAFVKNGGNLGSSGSVNFLFDHIGVIMIKSELSEEELFEMVIEAGAKDFSYNSESSEVITEFTDLAAVRGALEEKVEIVKSEPQYRAKDPTIITDPAVLEKLEDFIVAVEEAEDIDEVFGGFDVADDLLS
jgi:YebC/PmpR family DNA-binding regulatory protein